MRRLFHRETPSKALDLTRTVFTFGLMGHAPYGFMTFAADGKIRGYSNPQEDSYTYKDGLLSIFASDGTCSSDFVESKTTDLLFLPSSVGTHVLEPIFSLGALAPPKSPGHRPPVFVNTMAKAGTYLVAQALLETGYTSLDLHLSSGHFHDNRGVSPDDVHWDPNSRRVTCDAAAVAGLIRPGEFMVGHVDDLDQINKIRAMGTEVISVVRHPYDQIVSMMAFKERKTKPKPEDKIWQSMSGIERFKGFLLVHDARYWLSFAKQITENQPFLRFEDISKGIVKEGGVSAALQDDLTKGLKLAIGKPTSTLLDEKRVETANVFGDPAIKTYLGEMGLAAYASLHWPEVTHDE